MVRRAVLIAFDPLSVTSVFDLSPRVALPGAAGALLFQRPSGGGECGEPFVCFAAIL
jgi:hypothetical protein